MPNPQIPAGSNGTVPLPLTGTPANGEAWDILDPAGTVIATASAPGAWAETYSGGNATVSVPSGTTAGTNYKIRVRGGVLAE